MDTRYEKLEQLLRGVEEIPTAFLERAFLEFRDEGIWLRVSRRGKRIVVVHGKPYTCEEVMEILPDGKTRLFEDKLTDEEIRRVEGYLVRIIQDYKRYEIKKEIKSGKQTTLS